MTCDAYHTANSRQFGRKLAAELAAELAENLIIKGQKTPKTLFLALFF
jgi:hypothetical protein